GIAQRTIYPAVPLSGILRKFLPAPVGIDRYTFVGLITVGAVLGNIIGGRLFKPSSNSSPNPPSRC
ncbi:MAG: hypothetical protein ABL921_24750, partial [Pirellula sp.]